MNKKSHWKFSVYFLLIEFFISLTEDIAHMTRSDNGVRINTVRAKKKRKTSIKECFGRGRVSEKCLKNLIWQILCKSVLESPHFFGGRARNSQSSMH